MPKYMIMKIPNEGFMRNEPMYYVGQEKRGEETTIIYNAMPERARVFDGKVEAREIAKGLREVEIIQLEKVVKKK